MAQDTITNVWNEITISGDGIGITLYSESLGEGARVEDEAWFTFDELEEDRAGDIMSLNLSDATSQTLVDNQQTDLSRFVVDSDESDEVGPQVSEGDVLIDDNPAPWSDDTRVVVEEVTDKSSDSYWIDSTSTVALANPSYPNDDTVILGHYEGSVKTYAFPESRLVEA